MKKALTIGLILGVILISGCTSPQSEKPSVSEIKKTLDETPSETEIPMIDSTYSKPSEIESSSGNGIGDTIYLDDLKITLSNVHINAGERVPGGFDYRGYIVVDFTITNIGDANREVTDDPPYDIFFYIQDVRGKKYITPAMYMKPKWGYMVPDNTYYLTLYYRPDTPRKNANLIIESYAEPGLSRDEIVGTASFKIE